MNDLYFYMCASISDMNNQQSIINNQFNIMDIKDAERLERHLHTLNAENQQLKAEIQKLQYLNMEHTSRVARLEAQIQKSPIAQLAFRNKPMNQENIQRQIDIEINLKAFNIAHLEEMIIGKSGEIYTLTQMIVRLEGELEEIKLDKEQLTHRLQKYQSTEAQKDRQIQRLTIQNSQINQSRLKLERENKKLEKSLKDYQTRRLETLNELVSQLNPQRRGQANRQINDQEQLIGQYQKITKMHLEELEDRNKEILMLKTICQGSKLSPDNQDLKNTIKHLRVELSRYSQLIKKVTVNMHSAQAMFQEYKQKSEQCDKQLRNMSGLKQKCRLQENQIQQLKWQIEDAKNSLRQQKENETDLKKTLVEVLRENEVCHKDLYTIYGQSFLDRITIMCQQFNQRKSRRQKQDKWASIQEIVQVNKNLRRRLKIA